MIRNAASLTQRGIMTGANPIIEKLQSLQELWAQVGRTRKDSTEYWEVMAEIRVLSGEYLAMLELSAKDRNIN